MTDIHALLIGVDGYEPNFGPDRWRFPDLAGSVNDVLRMERFLRDGPLGVPEDRIRTLVSPGLFAEIEVPEALNLPTYLNIVREIEELTGRVGDGDQVLIHFSGHGLRVPSAEAAKGRRGLDEALVPLDGADPDGGVLRDVEIYRLLSNLSATGAYVTVILDSCHAGGAVRTGRESSVRVRGLGVRTGAWGPAESVIAPWADLYESVAQVRRARHRPGYRHAAAESGWFPQPKRCVLLAACRSPEVAREQEFESVGVSGAFTNGLLQALEDLGEEVSYETLQHSVRERIRALWAAQTPIFEGEGELKFLGAGRRPREQRVKSVMPDDPSARLLEQSQRFAHIRNLSTPAGSPLAGALDIGLFRLRRKEDWHDPSLREPVRDEPARSGELLCLLVQNRSDQVLSLVVLDVRPEKAIERVHPKRDEGEFAVIEPGRAHPVFLHAWLPDELLRVQSRLKVLAAPGPIDARRFEIPSSGARVDESGPVRAQAVPPLPDDDEWAVAEMGLTVVR